MANKMKSIRLTEEQLAALRRLAEVDETAKAVMARADAPKRAGVAKMVALAVFKNPAMTAAECKAAFPKSAEARVDYLYKEALRTIEVLKSCNRWREDVGQPAEKADKPARKAA